MTFKSTLILTLIVLSSLNARAGMFGKFLTGQDENAPVCNKRFVSIVDYDGEKFPQSDKKFYQGTTQGILVLGAKGIERTNAWKWYAQALKEERETKIFPEKPRAPEKLKIRYGVVTNDFDCAKAIANYFYRFIAERYGVKIEIDMQPVPNDNRLPNTVEIWLTGDALQKKFYAKNPQTQESQSSMTVEEAQKYKDTCKINRDITFRQAANTELKGLKGKYEVFELIENNMVIGHHYCSVENRPSVIEIDGKTFGVSTDYCESALKNYQIRYAQCAEVSALLK